MVLQQKIPIIPQPAIASYDFFDIADGSGYQQFYGTEDGAGNFAMVRTATVFSDNVETTGNQNTAGGVVVFNKNFEIVFNLPKTIKGKVLTSVPSTHQEDGAGNKSHTRTVEVFHYDGTTATSLGSGTSSTTATAGAMAERERVGLVSVDVSERHFKRGDTLRINVQLTATTSTASTHLWAIGHDPAGRIVTRTGELPTSQMVFNIPFRIDIS
jgi:hypothetical protein